MKKTIKFFSMAALAMMGAMAVSCSSDNDELISEQPVNKHNLVTTTLTVTMGDDATTRTLTDDGTTLSNTFAAGDKIVVFYNNATNGQTARAESNALAAGDITNSGKSAKFTITLTDPKLGNSSGFRAVYPSNMAIIEAAMNPMLAPNNDANTISYEFLQEQNGTLATLGTQLNVAVADGWLNDGKVPSFTLENKLAIAKFKIKDNGGNDITSNITGINIHVSDTYYRVNITNPQSYIYVAMKPVGTSETITFDAGTGSANYNRSVTGKELKAGHISPINLTMYLTVDNATETDKGKLICTDGHIHAYNADAGCTKARVALICYVGSETGEDMYTHGLALAMEDESSTMNWSSAKTVAADHTPAVTVGKWKLASKDEWNRMISGAGGYTVLRDAFGNIGGTNLKSGDNDYYHSSTDTTDDHGGGGCEWGCKFQNGQWYKCYITSDAINVRACLAF